MTLSMQSPRPLYQQVKDYILTRIESGEWPPDTRVPSESMLVRQLKVSRMTVNRALRELSAEGRLVRLQGVGTYVAPLKPLSTMFEIRSISEEIRQWGGEHSCEVYLLAEEKVFPELAYLIGLPVGAPAYHSIIVHKNREVPLLLGDRWVNPLLVPDYIHQDFTAITPTDYLLKVVPATDVEHIIEAILPDEMMQRLLTIDASEPCLMLHRQTWSGRQVVTHSRFIYPGSRNRIGGRLKPLPHNRTQWGSKALARSEQDNTAPHGSADKTLKIMK
jgi:GntR family histidine utilization transcriptional repressor